MPKNITRNIHSIDATDKAPGRVATEAATLLRGKNKPEFQPHLDCGDIVEVKNADKLKYTGKKLDQKKYRHHSGYPGGLKEKALKEVASSNPKEVVRRTVKRMLPAVRFRDEMMKRLIIK